MKNIKPIILILSMLYALQSCVGVDDLDAPTGDDNPPTSGTDPLADLNVPASFDFRTSKEVTVRLDAPDFLRNAVFTLSTVNTAQDTIPFAKATFNDDGAFEKTFTLPAMVDSVLATSNYLGLTDALMLPVSDNIAAFDYKTLYDRGNPPVAPSKQQQNSVARQVIGNSIASVTYTYLSDYNFWGVPDNLVFPDVIEQNLLDDINASLPELGFLMQIPNIWQVPKQI